MIHINEQARRVLKRMAGETSISEVARKTGISQQTLSRFLANKKATLSLRNYEKALPFLGEGGPGAGENHPARAEGAGEAHDADERATMHRSRTQAWRERA